MPLEIRELVIRTSVDRQNNGPATSAPNDSCATPSPAESNESQVNEVLQMIKDKNER